MIICSFTIILELLLYTDAIKEEHKSGPLSLKIRCKKKKYHAVLSTGQLNLFRTEKKHDAKQGLKLVLNSSEDTSVQVKSQNQHDARFQVTVRALCNDQTKVKSYYVSTIYN